MGPQEVKRLSDNKHFKIGDMTNFGKIKQFISYGELGVAIIEKQDKYFSTFPIHIEELHLLEDSKTPFERYHKNVCWQSAYLIRRKLNRRITFNPSSTNIKQWKDDLIWIKKWMDEHPEDKQTPFEKRGLMPNKENAFKILQSLTATEEKDKKWIEGWLKQNVQEFGRLYRNSDTITRIIHAFIGIQGVGKSKYQEDLIKKYKEKNPEKIVVSFPVGIGKGFSEKPPLGIIPKDIHNHNRLNDINEAINRYLEAKKDIPAEWLIEKRELVNKLK